MRPFALFLLLSACSAAEDDDLAEPVEYLTAHAWIMDRDEDCYTYRYFKANAKYWDDWITEQWTDKEVWGAQGRDLRCYFFPTAWPAKNDPFFFNDSEPGFFGSACSTRRFSFHDVCEGQVPFVFEDWYDWPAILPDGVVPE